ncbi:MAG: HTTM domain-containing protein [Planctomycetota bacterium]
MPEWWERFFHEPIDLSSLGLFRILLGLLLVLDAITYGRAAPSLLHPDGLVPFTIWRDGRHRSFFSVLRWFPASPRSVTVVLWIYGVAGFGVAAGVAMPWTAVVAFIAGVSVHHRNRYVLNAGDSLRRVLTFLLIFSGAGQVWSVDAALGAGITPAAGAPWALRLMQLQMAFLYLHAFYTKLVGRTWRRGTATHYATHLLAHRKCRLPVWLDRPLVHCVATYGTLLAEFAGAVLVWFEPTRYIALLALLGLHLSLQLLMRMHLFQWTMMAALVLFVPGEVTAGWLGLG